MANPARAMRETASDIILVAVGRGMLSAALPPFTHGRAAPRGRGSPGACRT